MLIFANPSTAPRKRRKTKTSPKRAARKGAVMAKRRRTAAQRAATARMIAANRRHKTTRNPRKATRRRTTHHTYRNPSRRRTASKRGFASLHKGILGELMSKDGLMLLGGAALAPVIVNFAAEKILPVEYSTGWYGLAAKAALTVAGAYGLEKIGQRKAAVGFAVGGLGGLIYHGVKMFTATRALPAAAPAAVADQIAANPAAYDALMSGNYNSLNGYAEVPMSGYEPMVGNMREEPSSPFESLN